jgi:hypothetical protein
MNDTASAIGTGATILGNLNCPSVRRRRIEMLRPKSWVRSYQGEMAVHAGVLHDGRLEIRIGADRYIAMTEAEWGFLPLWFGTVPF